MQENCDNSRFEIEIKLINIKIRKYSSQINADDYINEKYKTDTSNKKSKKKLGRSEKINFALAAAGILATIAFGVLALI